MWDEKLKKNDVSISKDGMVCTKTNNSRWFNVFGTKVWDGTKDKGVHEWRLDINSYSNGDKSGIIWGVCEESAK